MLLQGEHFERTDLTLYGGEGGGRNGEIVNKGQVYHDFWPGYLWTVAAACVDWGDGTP